MYLNQRDVKLGGKERHLMEQVVVTGGGALKGSASGTKRLLDPEVNHSAYHCSCKP